MDSQLLDKFFRKECSPEEVRQVLAWFEQQNISPTHEEAMRRLWEEAENQKHIRQNPHEAKDTLASIHQQIKNKSQNSAPRAHKIPSNRGSWAYGWRVAAILLIAFTFSWLLNLPSPEEQTVELPTMVVIETPPGMKQTTVLPDGSQVILNSRSRIEYLSDFGEHHREVSLNGEAFFEVAKDSLHPFTVQSGKLSTTALGTSFNIRYRPEQPGTAVSLVTGIVEIAAKNTASAVKTTKLHPGEQLNYDLTKNVFSTQAFDTLEILAWKDNIIYFKKSGLSEVIRELEDWYGVKIQVEGMPENKSAEGWNYTGTFKNQNLRNVLTGISYVKDFSFEIEGKNVKLIFHKTPAP
uniref:FecR domain-containing protein n=1 Tax=Roseihalotalea indica TaxID=2867963 RepID=A0AA49JIE5_9BACT|nr:FecR domain-containing protein [Tunicatimonas sp. TK19036]